MGAMRISCFFASSHYRGEIMCRDGHFHRRSRCDIVEGGRQKCISLRHMVNQLPNYVSMFDSCLRSSILKFVLVFLISHIVL